MAVDLCIVIVNWNGGAFVRRCIESLALSPPHFTHEILVIDNASTDGSREWLRSAGVKGDEHPVRIRLVENAENLGFGKANNQAFACSDAPLLLLLNNDTEVTPGAIDRMIATLNSDRRIGVCGPRLLNSDGSLQVSARRNPPAPWEILISGLRLYKLMPRRLRGELLLGRHWDHSRRRSVGMLSAAAILLKREVIEEVGGFDERFEMYAEDDEWCLRVARGGWRLVFEPGASVFHHGSRSASARWNLEERRLRILDEGLRFQRYSLSRLHAISNILASSLVVSLALLWRMIIREPTNETRFKLGLYAKHLKQALSERR